MNFNRKRIVLAALVALGLLAPALVVAQRQVGDRTPTADIDQPPREVGDLTWDRKADRQHSVLDGGATGTFPVDRVALPDLCEVMPGHPSCEDDPGGGGGGDGGLPDPIDPGPLVPMRCECPGMAVLPGGYLPAIRQFGTVQQCEEAKPNHPGQLECSSYSNHPGMNCVSLHVNRNIALLETHCRAI